MWLVAFMSALLVGTILGFDQVSAEPETDAMEDPTPEPDPVSPASDPTPDTGSDAPVDTPDPVDPNAGVVLTYSGAESILGGAGNDSIFGDPSDDVIETPGTTNIDLGGGDDLGQIALENVTATGGPGDDTLIGLVQNATIMGGDGNDTISGARDNDLQGGAGNDDITVELASPNLGTATIAGGEGDDTLRVRADITNDNTEAGSAVLTGDAGADTFDLEFLLSDTARVEDGPATLEANPNLRIMDFDTENDMIQIEILRPDGAEARDVTETVLRRDQDLDDLGPFTDVTLTFAGSDTLTEVTSTFRIYSATPITLEDIAFVTS